MGRPHTPELGAQLPQQRELQQWVLAVHQYGPNGGEVKAKDSIALSFKFSTSTSPKKDPGPEKDEVTTYPEGGLGAWLVVLGAFCGNMAALGTANNFGAFKSYFSTHQLSSSSPDAIGWIFSIYLFLTFGGSFIIGPVFDKYGPKWLILCGSVGVCSSMFLLGLCQNYWQFLMVFAFLGGGGSCLLYTPSVAVVGHYFHKKRGNAMGIAVSSSAIAGVAFPFLLEDLIPKVGFAWSTRVIGCIYVFVCVIACSFIKTRLPPAKNASSKLDFNIFKDAAFAVTVLAIFLLRWVFFVPTVYISSYALYHGFNAAFAAQVLVLLNLGSIFGRWLPGLISDRIGRFNSLILMTILIVVSVLGIWLPLGQTKAGLIVVALTFGFTSGSVHTLGPACIGQLCHTENYGRYLATAYTIAAVGILTGIPIGGLLVGRNHGDYWGLIVFVGAGFIAAVVALVVARVLKTGWKILVVY
ncbi:unnamed protein product [Calypogeia fissa]